MSDIPSLNDYLEMLQECYETIEGTTVGGVNEISEHEVEPRCDEAVGKHDTIGNIEHPSVNAALFAHSIRSDDVLGDHSPDELYESGQEYLADLAHQAAKYDLINRVLDDQKEAAR